MNHMKWSLLCVRRTELGYVASYESDTHPAIVVEGFAHRDPIEAMNDGAQTAAEFGKDVLSQVFKK